MRTIILLLLVGMACDYSYAQVDKWRDITPRHSMSMGSKSSQNVFSFSESNSREKAIEVFGKPNSTERRGDLYDIGYYTTYCYDGMELYFHDTDNPNRLNGFKIDSKDYYLTVKNGKIKVAVGMSSQVLQNRFPNSYMNKINRNGSSEIHINLGLGDNEYSDDDYLTIVEDSTGRISLIRQDF